MASRRERRQAKYEVLVRAGFDAATARAGRDWSWERINRELAQIEPEDTTLIRRSFQGIPSQERYKRNYHLLRSAGYSSKEAKKLRTRPPEQIQFLVTARHQRQPQRVSKTWFYEPFDKGYTQPFAYKVNYELVDESTEEIKNKWITLISHKELSYEDVEGWTLDTVSSYGETFNQIANIIAMKAGLVGGAR